MNNVYRLDLLWVLKFSLSGLSTLNLFFSLEQVRFTLCASQVLPCPKLLGSGKVHSKDSHGKTPLKWSPSYRIWFFLCGVHAMPTPQPLQYFEMLVSILFYNVCLVSITGKKIPARYPCLAKPTARSFIRMEPMFNFPLHRLLFQ